MRFSVALICVALFSTLTIGCGGGGDDSTAEADFVAHGNAICKKSMQELFAAEKIYAEKQTEVGSSPSKATAEKRYVASVVPPLERLVVEFEQLADSGSDADAFIASFQDGIETLENETAEVFNRSVVPFQEARKEAKELGLTACNKF